MKIYFKILFLCLSGFSHATVVAQFVSVPYSMSTPGGNVTMYQHVYMPTHYNNSSPTKWKFQVTLKNDSVINLKSKMLAKNKKMYVELKTGKFRRNIYPDETKQVVGANENGVKLTGMPTDSCWLFLFIKDPISCYSSVPSVAVYNTIAIQKGSGEIVSLNKENLKAMIDIDDKKVQRLIEKDNLHDAILRYNKVAGRK
jgi:hypothetical protein